MEMWQWTSEWLVWGLAAAAVSGVEGWGGFWASVGMMVVDYTQPQMMCCPAHISMNASLSHYLYIMATTPRRGQASSRLISPLTARPKEKWEARQRCSPLIHRLYLTPQPWIACSTHYMAFVISLYTWRYSQQVILIMLLSTLQVSLILCRNLQELIIKYFLLRSSHVKHTFN